MTAALFGLLFGAGLLAIIFSNAVLRVLRSALAKRAGRAEEALFIESPLVTVRRSLGPVAMVQLVGAAGGAAAGLAATGLMGMALLLGGLGALLPPFMAAPRRRRRQTREALAWSLWSRQLAELARAGSGLTESMRASVDHAPAEIASVVADTAAAAELHGLEAALNELSRAGTVWEPEVAAGLRMAAISGGAVADPLLDLCGRISDVVDLHRSKTEAVVELWTQTIALLSLAGGVVLLMYRNNPAYFEPYEQGTGQLVFVGIAGVLLLSTGFLVYHSIVRVQNSVLVPPRRRSRAKDPL